jgi:hypothetical protein
MTVNQNFNVLVWKLFKYEELFDVKKGRDVPMCVCEESKGNTPYISATGGTNGVSCYIKSVPSCQNNTITISRTGGAGIPFYQNRPYCASENIYILQPKFRLNKYIGLFLITLIKKERYRFNYGRILNEGRLKRSIIKLPSKSNGDPDFEFMESYIKFIMDKIKPISKECVAHGGHRLISDEWRYFRYSELFDIKKGMVLTKENMIDGNIPFISATDGNNGVRQYIECNPLHEGNTITVSSNGSIGEAFYQEFPYCMSNDVYSLYPKFELNKYIGLFLTTLIRKEKYRFNYGRKWNIGRMFNSLIKLPVKTDGQPDFEFMENYIKSLPYSASL